MALAEARSKKFEVYTARPGGVIHENAGILGWTVSLLAPSIRICMLGAAMVSICFDGGKTVIVENEELVRIESSNS